MLGDRNFSNDKLEAENLDHQQSGTQQSFEIRPPLAAKFRPQVVKDLVHTILSDRLSGKVYANEDMSVLTKDIAKQVRERVAGLQFDRYKILVQVVLGEQKGAGVKIGARCMWDSDADNYASIEYENDTLFCVVAVFAVFMY